jgi:hypothetical protein
MDSVLTAIEKLAYSASHVTIPSNYVDLSTNQSVAGVKTFTGGLKSDTVPQNPTDVVRKTELDALNISSSSGVYLQKLSTDGNFNLFNGADFSTLPGVSNSYFLNYYFIPFSAVNQLKCIYPCTVLLIGNASVQTNIGGDRATNITIGFKKNGAPIINKSTYEWGSSASNNQNQIGSEQTILAIVPMASQDILELDCTLSGTGVTNYWTSFQAIILPKPALPPYQPPAPTSATITPNPAYAQVGQTATFTVTSNGDTLSYQWSKNGSNIAGATNASYTTGTLTAGDNGNNYSCHIYNSTGSIDVSSSLQIVAAGVPTITTQPQDYSGFVGDIVELDIVATGATSWQWQRSSTLGGTYTNLTEGAVYVGTTTATLTDSGAIGYFRCVVSNSYGSVTSNSAHVTLLAG